MLPIVVISLAMAFFIMVRMGVFDGSKETKAKGRPSPASRPRRLLDVPPSSKLEDERLEIFEDFVQKPLFGADLVGVFHPKKKMSSGTAGRQPVEQGRSGASQVEKTGGARGETDDQG